MDKQQMLNRLAGLEQALNALGYASGVLYLDGDTTAPAQSAEGRSEALGYLSQLIFEKMMSSETKELLDGLASIRGELSPAQNRRRELLSRRYDGVARIPKEEYVAYSTLTAKSSSIWQNAKRTNDYASFAPCLEQILDFTRRFAAYKDDTRSVYNVLLDDYERGFTTDMLDVFFGELKSELVPLVHEIQHREPPRDEFLFRTYPAADQRRLAERVMDIMAVDRTRCVLTETEHPYTSGLSKWDVRISTHYYENSLASSLYSVIHESGHALYEMDIDDDCQGTALATDLSMGIHESQSRFYENIIGRSREFLTFLTPVLKEYFPRELENVTADQLYRAVNRVQPSLVRTEADELTYPMHIMIRYELEKLMLEGKAKVNELPALWNKLYKEYLGVEVPDDAHGILQDVHWSQGSLGYFPSYALGSAYGAQMLACMEKTVPVRAQAAKGDLSGATAWLKENVHHTGALYDPAVLLQRACGAPFDPTYYTRYLKDKYTDLYRL